jgi:hypothetical protein
MQGSRKFGGGDCPPESWARDPLRNLEPEDLGDPCQSVQSPSCDPRNARPFVGAPKTERQRLKRLTWSCPETMATAVCADTTSAALEEFFRTPTTKTMIGQSPLPKIIENIGESALL